MQYDPYNPVIDVDPHPTWRWLRDESPLYRNDRLGFYALSRYDDVLDALLDWQTYSSARGTLLELIDPLAPDGGAEPVGAPMIFTDPPYHDLLRRLVSRAFTPGASRPWSDACASSAAGASTPWPEASASTTSRTSRPRSRR